MNANSATARTRVILGKVGKIHGIKGWVRLNSYTSPAVNILNYRDLNTAWNDCARVLRLDDSKIQQNGLIVHFEGFDTPEQARELTGSEVWVDSTELPDLEAGSFYWHELQGLQVINLV